MQNQEKLQEKIAKIKDFAETLQVKYYPVLQGTSDSIKASIAYEDYEKYQEETTSTSEQDKNEEVSGTEESEL